MSADRNVRERFCSDSGTDPAALPVAFGKDTIQRRFSLCVTVSMFYYFYNVYRTI